MSRPNPEVDAYLTQSDKWQQELKALRKLVLDCGLCEEMKWGKPCYTFEGSNVAILYRFKDFCALGFPRGSLMDDPEGLLVAPGKHSQAMRRLQFTRETDIRSRKAVVRRYVQAAVAIVKSGVKVEFKEKSELQLPEELESAFEQNPKLKRAFEALTLGRQRGYVLHFSGAKQSKTRSARIDKHAARILAGHGLSDR